MSKDDANMMKQTLNSESNPAFLDPVQRELLYKRHVQGAFVRTGAIILLWLFLVASYLFKAIDIISFIGLSVTGWGVVFCNIPFLLTLKRLKRKKVFALFNLSINVVEILGDTLIIYFLGGIKGMYLIAIYAGLIAYIGVVAPMRYPYIIATMCSVFFSIMALMEHFGVIPHMNNQWGYHYNLTEVILILLVFSATLYVLAFNASYTSNLLRKNRKKLKQQNIRLEKSHEQINKAADALEQRNIKLKESMEELRQAQQKLIESEKMAALGGLVAGVAHEINNPVGVGITASSFLQEKIKDMVNLQSSRGASTEEINRFLNSVSEASKTISTNLGRAADLVQHFKQVAVDQFTEASRTFDLKEYIEGTLLSMRFQYKRTGHKISVNCPDQLIIDSYPGVFSQIITNLVMNSLSHGLEGVENGEIRFDISKNKDHLHIRYSDNGKGMNEETLQRVFEPFYTTRREQGGTGLGMHIVYNIVTQTLAGMISCTSSEGEGVVFDIRIPLKK
jgi:signal transduction histidine kinase